MVDVTGFWSWLDGYEAIDLPTALLREVVQVQSQKTSRTSEVFVEWWR